MATLEQDYQAALHAVPYEQGTPEYRQAKQELEQQLEAGRWLRDGGRPRPLYRAQQQFAVYYFALVRDFYGGEFDDREYGRRRIVLLRRYAQQLFKLGLVRAVFDDAWVRDFAEHSLVLERQLLPVKRTGLTDKDAALLCEPLRNRFKVFLRAVHAEFGVGRLRIRPAIYGGVDSSLQTQER